MDPYAIWLSEVILQQTRVNQGINYYFRFLERFPTVQQLADAPQDAVLETWQGLGYYSRARNLHATAQQIVQQYGGRFPDNYLELLKLKGIGPYTAAAISSFAFHEDQVAVDGNVLRVMTRLYNIGDDIRSPKTQAQIKELARNLLPEGQSYAFNQAMMELGATICTPSKPACVQCPVSTFCEARKLGTQSKLPFKSAAKERRVRYLNYLLLEFEGTMFFVKRGPKDIWEGLYEPVLIEADHAFSHPDNFLPLFPELGSLVLRTKFYPVSKHILSHQDLRISLLLAELHHKPSWDHGLWVSKQDLPSLPKPIVFSKILGLKKGTALPLSF